MTNYGPWSVKGIDQRAREAAREAAREEGLTIGEYINRMLLEETANEPPAIRDGRTPRYPRAVVDNDFDAEETPSPARGTFDKLIARLEAVEARSTLALAGIDQSLVGLVARLNRNDRKTDSVAEEVEATLEDLRATHDALQSKVRALEEDDSGARNLETLRTLEQALGKLTSQIHKESVARSDESAAFDARLETGLDHMRARIGGIEHKIESTLTEAAQKVERKIDQAELRAEGTAKHLSERFSELETNVSSRLTRIDQFQERMGAVEGDVAGALTSIESVMTRMQERLHRAETMTNSAMSTLEQTFESLDKRINTIAEQASPEKAAELRAQFEERFEGLASELRASIESTRSELAREIEKAAAAGASPDALKDIETSIGSLEQRVTAGEQRSNRALESMTEQVGRISSNFDSRLRDVESRDPSEAFETVRKDVEALSGEVAQRLEEFSSQNDAVIDRITEQMKAMADQFDARVEDSEQRSASAIEQVGEQVANVAQRLQAKQENAFEELKTSLESARKQQSLRLSDALSNVSDRIEQMQSQQASSLSPVQRAIASLATRLEALEDFASPPKSAQDEPAEYEFEDDAESNAEDEGADSLIDFAEATDVSANESFLVDQDIRPSEGSEYVGEPGELIFEDGLLLDESEPEIEASGDFAGDDEFEAGLPELDELEDESPAEASAEFDPFEDFDSAPAADADMAEPAADEEDPLSALVDWDDGRDETRDSDIFADEPEGLLPESAPQDSEKPESPVTAEFEVALDEQDEPVDYLSRARQAAMAANAAGSRNSTRAAIPAGKQKSSSKLPMIAAVSVVALATATAGTMFTLRGLQNDPGKPVVATTPQPNTAAIAPVGASEMAADEGEVFTEESASDIEGDAAFVDEAATEADNAALEEDLFDEPEAVADVAASEPAAPVAEPEPAPVEASTPEPAPQPAINFADLPVVPQTPTLQSAAAEGDPVARLILGEQRIADGDYTSGPTLVRQAAEAGEPAAQYRLAKLHEKGLGVPRDLAMARQWTERAAQGGNVKAMHDLAVYYAEGEGGPQSYAAAAEWFRKAADFGLTDSQYNLAVLYEAGLGISPSATEALYWYEIASRQGDDGAQVKINELRAALSLEAAQQAQRRAAAWSPSEIGGAANGQFSSQSWQGTSTQQVSAIQTVLAALGYEPGPADGIMGAGTVSAIEQYQTAAGLRANGQITPELVNSLNETVKAGTQTG